MSGYSIGKGWITCHQCGRTSHHPKDVEHRYCPNCHVFHDEGREFDCVECGRHIVSFGNIILDAAHRDTCAACFSIPGWFNEPEIARMLDPDNTRRPRTLQ
jgi:hypothetical protein